MLNQAMLVIVLMFVSLRSVIVISPVFVVVTVSFTIGTVTVTHLAVIMSMFFLSMLVTVAVLFFLVAMSMTVISRFLTMAVSMVVSTKERV